MADNRRTRRVQREMLRVLGRVLTTEVQDDRLKKNMVTITRTKVSADFSYLDVWISTQGEERFQKAMLSLVERAGGFLRRRLGEEVQVRVVPELRFHLDTTLDHAARIDELLGKVSEERKQRARAQGVDLDDDEAQAQAESEDTGTEGDTDVEVDTDTAAESTADAPALDGDAPDGSTP